MTNDAEKFGVATSQRMDTVYECANKHDAIRQANTTNMVFVWYAHGQWWF